MKSMLLLVMGCAVLGLVSSPAWAQTSEAVTQPLPSQLGATGNFSAPAQASLPPASPHSDGYTLVIGVGDLLETTIFGTDYSCGTIGESTVIPGCRVRVSTEGDITLPLIGRVKVAGLTVEQAEDLISERLVEDRFYKDPHVTIVQKEFATQGVSVLGEVQKPGTYPLLGPHTLLEAISAAGGTTAKAGNDVSLTHRYHHGSPEHLQLNDPSANKTPIEPGDVVMVSKAGIVYVVGDVHQPSGVVMESSGLTVLQALAMAQGANSTAALDQAKLIRTTPQGRQEIAIPVKKILSNKAVDVRLQPADILFIPTNKAKAAGRRSLEAILQTASGVAIYRP
jgi:polysaccharide export outer membrane protein